MAQVSVLTPNLNQLFPSLFQKPGLPNSFLMLG